MKTLDDFARLLLEEAKRFLEKAKAETTADGRLAYLHAALLQACCALEAHVNAVADDFVTDGHLDKTEQSLLTERELALQQGRFVLTNKLQMRRLEDRLEFLVRKYSGKPVDKDAGWWSDLKAGLHLRNALTHAREDQSVSIADVERCLGAVVDAISALYRAVYRAGYPPAGRKLDSTLDF